ncbi:hypothetical protein [Streptomyces sp. NPDC048521]|uniref:hypothetical protein n=1 Tax=Streptomyces sp. NPDC048521 TaxID=3365566 RepID=UPI003711E09E
MNNTVARGAKQLLKAVALGGLVLAAVFGTTAAAAEATAHPQHTVTVQADGDGGTDGTNPWG